MTTMESKMQIATAKFGKLEADPATFISFNDGVYGFPKSRRFVLIETGDARDFRWLQSVEEPELAFLVTDPTLFYPQYRASVDAEQPLVAAMGDDYQLLAIVAVDRATRRISVNLAAPLAVHVPRREGRQLILHDRELRTDHDLLSDYRALLTGAAGEKR